VNFIYLFFVLKKINTYVYYHKYGSNTRCEFIALHHEIGIIILVTCPIFSFYCKFSNATINTAPKAWVSVKLQKQTTDLFHHERSYNAIFIALVMKMHTFATAIIKPVLFRDGLYWYDIPTTFFTVMHTFAKIKQWHHLRWLLRKHQNECAPPCGLCACVCWHDMGTDVAKSLSGCQRGVSGEEGKVLGDHQRVTFTL
jgi:hypothetical protein